MGNTRCDHGGYAREFPEESYFVDLALKFRVADLEEFNRQVRDDAPITDLPQVEEMEFVRDVIAFGTRTRSGCREAS